MRVRITPTTSKAAVMLVARTLRITPRDAQVLLATARVLPADLDAAAANALADGLQAALVDVPPSSSRCASHPTLTTDASCESCSRSVCPLCVPRCADCQSKQHKSASWKRVRVAVLLLVLAGVGVWGLFRHRELERRHAWLKPLRVTVVLASSQPVDERTRDAWNDGVKRLETWFADEAERHRFRFSRPLTFELAPENVNAEAPTLPSSTGEWLADSQSALELRNQLQVLVEQSGAGEHDLSIVVGLRKASGAAHRVEGLGEASGSTGLVDGTNGDTAITLELLAVAHELLHLLGAKDGYDEDGHARPQRGFAEPDLGYAQQFAEVMVGEIPVSATEGKLPTSLQQVRIGDVTALEIGWR
ncbi:MAG: hypothetical protein ACO1OB_09880 [Archangium sp.]